VDEIRNKSSEVKYETQVTEVKVSVMKRRLEKVKKLLEKAIIE
jgi:hypothetical protein